MTSHYVADESLLIFLYALNLSGDVGNELVYLGALVIKVRDDLLLFFNGWDGHIPRAIAPHYPYMYRIVSYCSVLLFVEQCHHLLHVGKSLAHVLWHVIKC